MDNLYEDLSKGKRAKAEFKLNNKNEKYLLVIWNSEPDYRVCHTCVEQ